MRVLSGFALILLLCSVLVAQAPAVVPEKLTEVEQLKLQLVAEKQRRITAEFQAAMSVCEAQPATRAILNSSDSADAEMQKLLQGFFDAHKLSPDQYKIDPASYEFKKVP